MTNLQPGKQAEQWCESSPTATFELATGAWEASSEWLDTTNPYYWCYGTYLRQGEGNSYLEMELAGPKRHEVQ